MKSSNNRIFKHLAVAFTGPSNSGKTTLIINLSNYLQGLGFKVAIIKHDPANKAIFDKEGKDSYNFSQTGANVAVMSPEKTTVFKNETSSIDEIINMLGTFDYLLVEGLKTLPLPRICVCRTEIYYDYLDVCSSIALGENIEALNIPEKLDILELSNMNQIVSWINTKGKIYASN